MAHVTGLTVYVIGSARGKSASPPLCIHPEIILGSALGESCAPNILVARGLFSALLLLRLSAH